MASPLPCSLFGPPKGVPSEQWVFSFVECICLNHFNLVQAF
jgi:hypothetical protein